MPSTSFQDAINAVSPEGQKATKANEAVVVAESLVDYPPLGQSKEDAETNLAQLKAAAVAAVKAATDAAIAANAANAVTDAAA